MEIVGQLLDSVLAVLNIQFTIWGFTLTLWKVFAFSFVSIVISRLVWGIISDD